MASDHVTISKRLKTFKKMKFVYIAIFSIKIILVIKKMYKKN